MRKNTSSSCGQNRFEIFLRLKNKYLGKLELSELTANSCTQTSKRKGYKGEIKGINRPIQI